MSTPLPRRRPRPPRVRPLLVSPALAPRSSTPAGPRRRPRLRLRPRRGTTVTCPPMMPSASAPPTLASRAPWPAPRPCAPAQRATQGPRAAAGAPKPPYGSGRGARGAAARSTTSWSGGGARGRGASLHPGQGRRRTAWPSPRAPRPSRAAPGGAAAGLSFFGIRRVMVLLGARRPSRRPACSNGFAARLSRIRIASRRWRRGQTTRVRITSTGRTDDERRRVAENRRAHETHHAKREERGYERRNATTYRETRNTMLTTPCPKRGNAKGNRKGEFSHIWSFHAHSARNLIQLSNINHPFFSLSNYQDSMIFPPCQVPRIAHTLTASQAGTFSASSREERAI
ncbi:uncharacterized protein J3D65DRAFT_195664 [Phyllosticta citribraziliensis]|uniref:Uncharacterized protein n=1 Tax=Phyllosticta citribraziliensis TaxID=989973 RepID=A0ABR1M342_9PEZI